MTQWSANFGLPLLEKELIEQAARKRTYVVRVLYASLLFFVAYLMFYETLRAGAVSPLAALGRGRQMFDILVGLQFGGIYLFMPAITCSVIAHEKERASLQLLFLTRLGPWTILFEKLLSRLIPMTGFLLLSLPLLAYAYALGGISPEHLGTGIWLLLITTFQVGAIALCCSAWSRTTAGAFVASYLVTALVSIGPGLTIGVLLYGRVPGSTAFEQLVMQSGLFDDASQILFPFFGPVQFLAGGTFGGAMRTGLLPRWIGVMARSLPIALCGVAFLILARRYIVRRAFMPPRNFVLNILKSIDGAFVRLNQNPVTRGIVVVEDKAHLPVDAPVAWRETTKRSLGRGRYLFRLLLVLEVPLLAFCFGQAIFATDMNTETLTTLIILLWFLAMLVVSVQAASLIAGERTRQTLDVLCTTPLTSRQIVLQKFRSVQRLMRVLWVPFFTLTIFKGWWGGIVGLNHPWRGFDSWLYVICAALSVFVYLPMIAWLSLYIGMLVKSQARAVVAALGALVGWCLVPMMLVVLPLGVMFQPRSDSGFGFLFLLSPAAIVPLNEFGEWRELANLPWVAVVLNFMGYGMCLFLLRQLCLASADRLLGRVEYYDTNDVFNDWPYRRGVGLQPASAVFNDFRFAENTITGSAVPRHHSSD
jgi:ABC-type transport system involved in multi-copper enzyme maturation permease subunit